MVGESTQPLNEFITLQRGFDLPAGDRLSGSVPVVAANGVAGVHNESKVKAPGVVIGRSGSIGGGQYVTSDFWPLNTTLWVKDFKGHNERFVYYLLKSIDFSVFNVGSGVPTLNRNHLSSVQVTVKPRSEQDLIAEILGALDDKIELNRQMNETLGAMAQALFKSWFVDFDPVIDNALVAGNEIPEPLQARAAARQTLGDQRKQQPPEILAQFPSSFVFTDEMGWIPEGWEAAQFGSVARQIRENVKAEDVSQHSYYVGLEHISRKSLFLSSGASGEDIESNKSKFEKFDLLFGKLRPYFHKVCIAPKDGICSTDILVFRARAPHLHSFMILTAFTEEFVEFANLRSTGTRMPRASAKDMLAYMVALPSAEVLEAFENLVSINWERGFLNTAQMETLAGLRDTLLPRLLSGELRVNDAEQQIAEVL